MNSLLTTYSEACNYPGVVDEGKVTESLGRYLQALGVTRKIVRLQYGWTLEHHPDLKKSVYAILDDFAKRTGHTALAALDARDARDARDALAARAARDARDARAARDARDALDALDARAARVLTHCFAQWCFFRGAWWWSWDLSWISTTHFGAIQLNKPAVQKWTEPIFDSFAAGAWLLYWTEDTLFWCAKPDVHTEQVNGRKRLHNGNYAALECDIENLYFWHGVMVPAFVVVKPEWITVTHIETETNAEVRRVMIDRYGQDKYLVDSGAEEIHRDDFGILYRKEIPGDEPLVMVKVVNSTPEPDGSFKDYFIRVPPAMERARQAVAWTFGKKEEEYAPCVET